MASHSADQRSESRSLRQARALLDLALPASRRPDGRWLRLAGAAYDLVGALVETGSLEALELQRYLLCTVRRPQTRPRVIAVAASKGGVGTTTTARAVATVLAALREDTTALVAVHPRPPGWQDDAVAHLTVVDAPDVVPRAGSDGPAASDRANDVLDLIDVMSDRHAFTVLDVGNDTSAAAQAALHRADQVVVVTGSRPESIEHARLALRRAGDERPGGGKAGHPVVAAVRTRPSVGTGPVRHLTEELGLGGDRLVTVPYHVGLARSGWRASTPLSGATLSAYLTLTALITAAPPGSPDQGRRPGAQQSR